MRILIPLMFLLFTVSCDNQIESNTEELTEIVVTAQRLPEVQINPDELECLAANIYFEARGEPHLGKLAVAHVTLNRVRSKSFPNDICGVVYQAKTNSKGNPIRHKCQFSWYCDGKREVIDEKDKYEEIKQLAHEFLSAPNEDITDGAEFYHAVSVSPFWRKSFQQTVVINDHIFYKKG